jgi:ASPM-SPD-2-Hydin domain-containing protein
VTVGKTSAARTITITNKSTATGTLQSFDPVIPPQSASGNFAVATNSCLPALPLAAGGSCKITVTFTPTKSGSVTASVMLLDNAPDTPEIVTLTGTGQ